jgi:putative tricarboxylic transport membrane protein
MFPVGEVLVIRILGYVLLRLGFHPAPILLGFVLGSRFEENFRRAMLIARGDLSVFVTRPISAVFIAMCVMLIASQIYFRSAANVRAAPEQLFGATPSAPSA